MIIHLLNALSQPAILLSTILVTYSKNYTYCKSKAGSTFRLFSTRLAPRAPPPLESWKWN